jgi:trehalose 2-sulfotransferase
VADESRTPSRGYLLCCIERTGSSLITGGLRATGVAGRPREYFNPALQNKSAMREVLGELSMVSGFSRILSAATSSNGVFGSKLHFGHLQHFGLSIVAESRGAPCEPLHLLESLRSHSSSLLPVTTARELLRSWGPHMDILAEAYGKFSSAMADLRTVLVTRRNMVARAVSHFRARHSGIWQRREPPGGEIPGDRLYDFDVEEIHGLYCLADFQQNCWRELLLRLGVAPLEIVYEDLAADYEGTIRRTLQFLHLEGKAIRPPTSLRQADEVSQEWEAQYREQTADLGVT